MVASKKFPERGIEVRVAGCGLRAWDAGPSLVYRHYMMSVQYARLNEVVFHNQNNGILEELEGLSYNLDF